MAAVKAGTTVGLGWRAISASEEGSESAVGTDSAAVGLLDLLDVDEVISGGLPGRDVRLFGSTREGEETAGQSWCIALSVKLPDEPDRQVWDASQAIARHLVAWGGGEGPESQ